MTTIDPSTNLGKLRLRCGDWTDLPWLPDSVYLQTLTDNSDNLPLSAKICATYILGMLSFQTHRKMGLQLEVWGSEAYENYKSFLMLTVTNPNFMYIAPIVITAPSTSNRNSLNDFISDWNRNYYNGTQSQELALDADIGPNDGGRYGPLGFDTSTWFTS